MKDKINFNLIQIILRFAKENKCVNYLKEVDKIHHYLETDQVQLNGDIMHFRSILISLAIRNVKNRRLKEAHLLYFTIFKSITNYFIEINNLSGRINTNLQNGCNEQGLYTLEEYYNKLESDVEFGVANFFRNLFSWHQSNEGYQFWFYVEAKFYRFIQQPYAIILNNILNKTK